MATNNKEDVKSIATDVLIDRKETLRKELEVLHLAATGKVNERAKKMRGTVILLVVTLAMGLGYRLIYGVQTGSPSLPVVVFGIIVFGCVITLSNLPTRISAEEIAESNCRKKYEEVSKVLFERNALPEGERSEVEKKQEAVASSKRSLSRMLYLLSACSFILSLISLFVGHEFSYAWSGIAAFFLITGILVGRKKG